MFKILLNWFAPINRYSLIGVILFFLGLFLLPFLIGFPIMTLGWLLMTFGIFYHYITLFPAGRKIIEKAKEYFKEWFIWYKKLFKEVFK